jgi:hypothetical protein
MTKQRACGAIAIALIAVVPAGCGSDDKSSSDNAPTKAEFVKQADAICQKGSKEIDQKGKALFGGGQKPTSAQQKQFATEVLLPNVEQQVSGVDNLTPPKGDEDQVNAIVTTAHAAIEKGKSDPAALLSDKDDPFAKTNKLAREYGLKVCGQ